MSSLDVHVFCLKVTVLLTASTAPCGLRLFGCFSNLADHYSNLASGGSAQPPGLYCWHVFGGEGMITTEFKEASSVTASHHHLWPSEEKETVLSFLVILVLLC